MKKLIENIRPMGAMEAHWLKNQLYNLEFGLYNCFTEQAKFEPLAVVRAFKQEDPLDGTYLNDLALRYYEGKIHEYFKISLVEYLRLPMPYARKLDDIARNLIRPLSNEKQRMENDAVLKQLNERTPRT